MLQISQLFIYPVKSLAGIPVSQAKVTATGFEHDRRWMLVDGNNGFISQRECPELTQLQPSIQDDGLLIAHKTKGDLLRIPFNAGRPTRKNGCTVTIWDDNCSAHYVSEQADQWFSSILALNCRLVYMTDADKRPTDPDYAAAGNITSFADAFPYLIIGQASLDDLNQRLDEKISIDRFRPNIVFTGGEPYLEDSMARLAIGDIEFYGVKLCGRCMVTTIDQQTAVQGKEPLKTLASYRQKNNKINFGQNLIHQGEGMVSVGDMIKIIS